MSIGAEMAGIDVKYAVECDPHAARTYNANHTQTAVFAHDIRRIKAEHLPLPQGKEERVIFGGPPCQGFSTSNQTNRDFENENNWLYREYLRLVGEVRPDWVVFENVKGLIETESGVFLDSVLRGFKRLGYTTSHFVLNSADFGVPQRRNRLFIIGSLHGLTVDKPKATVRRLRTVREAIEDLPELRNGDAPDHAEYKGPASSTFSRSMRGRLKGCWNNIVTNNSKHILTRYRHIPQGGNWEDIPKRLMKNYTDVARCHTGIYHRLNADEPSIVIGNFRKNMLVHPWEDRGLSARLSACFY